MYKNILIKTGYFSIEYIDKIPYLTCDDEDLSYQSSKDWSENKAAPFLLDFIKLNLPKDLKHSQLTSDHLFSIKEYTNNYGLLADMGHHRERWQQSGNIIPESAIPDIPFKNKVAMPMHQFVYFHTFMVNIFELKQALNSKNERELVTEFLYLFFQPYAGMPFPANDPYMGISTEEIIGDFPLYIWTFHNGSYDIKLDQLLLYWRAARKLYQNVRKKSENIIQKYKMSVSVYDQNHNLCKSYLPPEFVANADTKDYRKLYDVLKDINAHYDIGNFIIDGNKDDIKKKDTQGINLTPLVELSKLAIEQHVNAYIRRPSYALNEQGKFVYRSHGNLFISDLFNELINVFDNYEVRTCAFPKCRAKFIYIKDKSKLCCCPSCCDKYSKLKKRQKGSKTI